MSAADRARRKEAARLAATAAGFAEQAAWADAHAAGELPYPDLRPIRSTRRPAGFTGLDYQVRIDTMHITGRESQRLSDDVGCTVAALDWQEKSYERRKVAGGTSLTTTATGGKRLHAAGPGQPEQAKQVAK